MSKFQIEAVAKFLGYEYISEEKAPYDYGWWKKGTFRPGMSAHTSDFICMADCTLTAMFLGYECIHKVWDKIRSINPDNFLPEDEVLFTIDKDSIEDAILYSERDEVFIRLAEVCIFLNNLDYLI